MKKQSIKKTANILLDILEIHIPSILFLVLFACFILGIFFRYVLRNPQSWTFELSTICYVAVGVLSWGIAHRADENVVFDMLYLKMSPKTQCIMRLISNVLITMTAALLIEPAYSFMMSMAGLKAQTMPIPRGLIFLPFMISFVMASARSLYRLVLDILAFKNKDYVQQYGKKEITE